MRSKITRDIRMLPAFAAIISLAFMLFVPTPSPAFGTESDDPSTSEQAAAQTEPLAGGLAKNESSGDEEGEPAGDMSAADATDVQPFAADDPPIFGNCSALSTFDTDNEGWRFATTNYGGASLRSTPRAVGWQPNVGNPGGGLIDTDPDAGWSELWTPSLDASGYTTDYRFTIGSTVAFDYKNNTGIAYNIYMSVVGANGKIYWFNFRPQIVNSTQWTRVVVPLDASRWRTGFNNSYGVNDNSLAPTDAEFEAALSDVDRFTFSVEGRNGPDTTMFDNFGLPCDDFGDAPDTYGTTLAQDGPSHTLLGYSETRGAADLMLGSEADHDTDGQPGAAADGDDITDLNDEDGVANSIYFDTGRNTTVPVSVTNDTASVATLAGWLDLNGDGQFDSGERVAVAVPANSGTQEYEIVFPAGTTTEDTYVRFRVFSGDIADPLPTGRVNAGEVEDYPVHTRQLSVMKSSDFTSSTRIGDTVTYTVTATNTGSGAYTADSPAVVFDDLTDVLDDSTYGEDAVAEASDSSVVPIPSFMPPSLLSWSGPLATGESIELTYSVILKNGGDGVVRNVAFVSNCDPADAECVPVTPVCEVDDPTCHEELFELPRLSIEKTAGRSELPAVGEAVEYTVTVTNEGPGVYTAEAPATFTDDLSNVLDAADYNDDAVASTGEVLYDDSTLSWEGALAAGESATVTYTATYTGEGDKNLRNLACVPENQVLSETAPCAIVQIPGAGLTQWKQVEASDTPAVAGSVLQYTLFFKNDGEAAAAVDAIDDLTHVLDDADVSVEPISDDLTVARDGNRIAITGSVAPGETSSATYQVTVKADGDRGDDVAGNFLLAPEEEVPSEPICESPDTNGEFPDCTITPISAVVYEKTVEASETPVGAGTVLAYTVTAENTGAVAATVSREDVLTDVLDDAELTSAPESDIDSVTVSDVEDGRFQIGGELAVGETATITYQVTVNSESARGNNVASNFIVLPGEAPPMVCVEGSTNCTSTLMPAIEVTKTVTPDSGTTVVAGQELGYTLTFTNTGAGTGNVDYTDHLADVLDDADLTAGPTVSDASLTAELGADETVKIVGSLAAGQTVTVNYSVTVLPDGQRSDDQIGNVLAPSAITDPECGAEKVSCTENLIPLLETWKTVESEATPVAAGTVLTYTLHFENTGKASAVVDEIDDLTHVLDDADVTVEPTSGDLTVTRDGNRIAVTGSVAPGETSSVTYQVTIREDGERGDDIAANYLMSNNLENPPIPPAEPVCQPTDSVRPDCTITPIGRLLTGKAVSADTDPIDVGTVLTYTLTFDNQGEGPAAVSQTDHLADVFDDATLTQAPAASDDALSVSAVQDDQFSVTGELAAGQTVIVTYQATVNAENTRGNNSANNFLVAGDEEPSGECLADDQNCTSTPLPLIEPSKTADPVSGTGVQAGQGVTYTLSFTNSGAATGRVDYTDRLDAVLDDAVLTLAPVSSDPAIVVTSGADGLVRVTGSLMPGQTVTVSYTATVKPDGERGDNQLRNVVAKTSTTAADCDTAGAVCTNNPVGELESWKSVDPASGASIAAGAEATYTLHFENTGNAPVDVNEDDVLTQVIDDADVTAQPAVSTDALLASEIVDARFNVAGTLEAGEQVTVTYTVTVKADGERGDDRLGNFLVRNGEIPPEGPCAPVNPERPNCTLNHVSDVAVVKSSDPESGTEVGPNGEVTYTLTFTNVSNNPDAAPAVVDYTDHMADVLDDAILTSGPAVSAGELIAVAERGTIQITGVVPVGGVVTVGYTVTVKSYDAQVNHRLGNVIAVAGEEPVCTPDSPLCTAHDLVPGPQLPITGAELAWGALGASLMLIVGGAAMVAIRRRRGATEV